jgi:hypothetical protein
MVALSEFMTSVVVMGMEMVRLQHALPQDPESGLSQPAREQAEEEAARATAARTEAESFILQVLGVGREAG